ncbi:MAG: hypothetical protein IJH79_05650 [Lentisphaeria bacterium]|nr:hypothetical protein [Lentisphaeria bacterium]
MKRNILYLVLNSAALGTALLVIGGFAALSVWAVLGLGLMALKLDKYISDPLAWSFLFILFAVMLAGGIFLVWKYGRHKLVQEEKKARGESILLWETPAILLFFLLLWISWKTDLDWPCLIGLGLPPLALIIALIFPFRHCPDGFWSAVRIMSFLSAFSVFFWGSLILGRCGKEVSYQGNDPAKFPRSVLWIGKTYIPEGASDIRLDGSSAACTWTCRVSEKDFLKFKAKSGGIEFEKHEKPRDIFDKGPFPYYVYENRRSNGGGITLRYEVKTEKMTGSYSHH